MTVSVDRNFINQTANGALTEFTFDFLIQELSHCKVYLDGVEQSSGYTVTGLGVSAGGLVIFAVAPADGVTVSIYREVPITQETRYRTYGRFPGPTFEADLDKSTFIDQQIAEKLDRALTANIPYEGDTTVPVGGNQYLKWNSDGSALTLTDGTVDFAGAAALETKTLSSSQLLVQFTEDIATGAFFISGPDVDNGRLLETVDYVADTVARTITLHQSYPEGTLITLSYVDLAAAQQVLTVNVASLSDLRALTAGANLWSVYLAEDGRAGNFKWDPSDLSTEVAADTQSGIYVAPNSDLTGASGAWVRQYSGAVNVKWFGAVGDGVTDDTEVFSAMVDIAHVFIPVGRYLISSNVSVRSYQTWRGSMGTTVVCDDCFFGASGIVAGEAVHHFTIQNLLVERINSTATTEGAFVLEGDTATSGVKDVYRFSVSNVHVTKHEDVSLNRVGSGYEMKSVYIGTIANPIIQGCALGLRMDQQSGRSTGVNGVPFFGGEIQTCNKNAELYDVSNLGFYSTLFEGGAQYGVELKGACEGVGFYNTYLEGNAGYDFKLSDASGGDPNRNITFNGVTARADVAVDYSLILESAVGVSIDGYNSKIGGNDYQVALIQVNGASDTKVIGTFKNCFDGWFNQYRNTPICPAADAKGLAIVTKETRYFYNAERSVYEQDVDTVTNVAGAETTLRTFTVKDGLLGSYGNPCRIVASGKYSTSGNTKYLRLYIDSVLYKEWDTTAINKNWTLDIDITQDPTISASQRVRVMLINAGVAEAFETAISVAGDTIIEIKGECLDADVSARSSYLQVVR